MTTDYKTTIIEALDKIRKVEIIQNNPYGARAYARVINQIKLLEKVEKMDDLKEVKGIGKGIKGVLEEIFNTGETTKAIEYNSNMENKFLEELQKIHGVGPSKAKELVLRHGIKSIEELKEKQDLLNDKQKIGLKYYGQFDIRIPKAEMLKHELFIKKVIESIDPNYIVEIAGSFRRGAEDSGDIDVIITHPNEELNHDKMFDDIVEKFKETKYITDLFAKGNKKCLAVSKILRHKVYRRLDLLMTKNNEFPFALLYFTGSQLFNIEMRNVALEKGYSLSEYGLKHLKGENKGEFVNHIFTKEEDIFEFLGYNYVPPTERKENVLQNYKKSI